MILARRIAAAWLGQVARQPVDEVVYVALFLDLMGRQRLLKRFGQSHPDLQADHMTLWHFYDGGTFDVSSLPLGKTIPLKIIGYVVDDRAQLVIVQSPPRFRPVSGRTPHITISTKSGVPPAYANTLIAKDWDAEEARRGFPALNARVGWWDGKQVRFDQPKS